MWVIKPKDLAAGGALVAGIALLFLFPEQAKSGAAAGLSLSAQVLIPSLFPFMVLSLFLTRSGVLSFLEKPLSVFTRALFRSNSAIAILLAFIGGFPLGGQLIGAAYRRGEITAEEANARLACGVNPGPAFVITAVGMGMLGSKAAGVLLFCAITAASVINGVIFSRILVKDVPRRAADETQGVNLASGFVTSVSDSVTAMITIAGYAVFFSSVISILNGLNLGAPVHRGLGAVLEVTTGAALLKDAPLPLLAGAIGFGGVSVHCQVLSALRDVPVRLGVFYLGRLTHAALATGITWVLLRTLPISVPTIVSTGNLGSVSEFSLPLTLAMMLMSVTLIASVRGNGKQR